LYVDPPWPYRNQGTRAATDNHYHTLSLDEIAAIPVRELAGEKSHLHLWTTNAHLPVAFSLIESWGFDYKSCLVWMKPQMGIGNYWRVSHEFLLLGVRGGLAFENHAQKSWLEVNRQQHSQKPEEFRELIEQASPGPYLELFARKQVQGWTVWGKQVSK
jgi:N6-adenosine-specific RNA methylase IME4